MRIRDSAVISRLVADVLYGYGFLLLVPLAVALAMGEREMAITFGVGAGVFIPGFGLLRQRASSEGVQRRHAAMALALMWTLLSVVSFVPFVVYGMGTVDAFFESFSAWTDTGLTMLPHPERLPVSLSVFRVLVQWVSGLGIVILALSLYGQTSRAAQSLFQAEGRREDFATSMVHIGRTSVLIYVGYTLIGFALLWILGVPPFEALVHAATSLSTGGFSTNPVGVGLYGPLASIVAMLLMICGGISFGSHHALLNGRLRGFWRNPEIRVLFAVVVLASGLLVAEQLLADGYLKGQILPSVFYAVSAVSTCGAGTVLPLSQVPDTSVFTVMLLMISGAAFGSTTGALKLWRLIIVGQVIGREVKRPFYPEQTVMPVRVGDTRVRGKTVIEVTAYVLLYLTIAVVGSLVFMLFGHSALHSLFTVFSAQGNVGLNAMPDSTYFGLHAVLKVQLILHMLLGRMEILPLLYLVRRVRE